MGMPRAGTTPGCTTYSKIMSTASASRGTPPSGLSRMMTAAPTRTSFKSKIGDSVAQFRASHRSLPGSERLMRLTRGDFNEIFLRAWHTFKSWSQHELAELDTNATKSGWKGTGLCPYVPLRTLLVTSQDSPAACSNSGECPKILFNGSINRQ